LLLYLPLLPCLFLSFSLAQEIPDESEASGAFEFVNVPHTWKNNGYGTYHLSISGLIKGNCYSLSLYDTKSAYKLYINSDAVAQNGVVGKNHKEEIIHLEPQIVTFTADNEPVQIFMQVSNFHIGNSNYQFFLL